MHDGKRLLTRFDKLWQKYRKRLADCQQAASEEAVHKLRISCRRLLALIQLLQFLAPLPALRKLRKKLKTQLDNFDELRDTQVMLLEIADSMDALPALASYHRYLQHNEQRLLAQAPLTIRNVDSAALQQLFDKTQQKLAAEFGTTSLKPQLLAAIDAAYAAALDRYRLITAEQPATLHQLRIAVKKLRYMLDASQDLLPALPDHHLQHLQAYLTRLGDIQNSCVLLESINRFFGHHPPPDIQNYYARRHQALLDDYWRHGSEILQFWRAKTHLAFPWQADG